MLPARTPVGAASGPRGQGRRALREAWPHCVGVVGRCSLGVACVAQLRPCPLPAGVFDWPLVLSLNMQTRRFRTSARDCGPAPVLQLDAGEPAYPRCHLGPGDTPTPEALPTLPRVRPDSALPPCPFTALPGAGEWPAVEGALAGTLDFDPVALEGAAGGASRRRARAGRGRGRASSTRLPAAPGAPARHHSQTPGLSLARQASGTAARPDCFLRAPHFHI